MNLLYRFRIATRLAALGLFLLAATVIVGIGGWRGLDRMHDVQRRSAQTDQAYATAADTARVAQVDFKKQVQEWKDLLLRGHDADAFAKHRAAFVSQADAVQADLSRLRGQLLALGSSVADVDGAMATHAGLREQYLAALEVYGPDAGAAQRVDARVKGIDRAPTTAIDGIVARVLGDLTRSSQRLGATSAAAYHAALVLLGSVVLGALLTGVVVTVLLARSITRPIGHAVSVAEAVAGGDLGSRIVVTGRDETAQLLGALSRMNAQLRRVVAAIREGADDISHATGEIAEGNLDLSSRTSEQAAALEETASSMQEFTSGVHANAAAARQASTAAGQALAGATQSESAMAEAVTAMDRIASVSDRIAEITATIERIASQTHILALNAAVEAARAGEAGKGFHVVAAEVRSLASHAKGAAGEIRGLVADAGESVTEGSQRLDAAGRHMGELAADVHRVAEAVRAIAGMSDAQAAGVLEVNQAVRQIDEVTQSNSALVEQAAAAADAVKHRARALVESVAFFRLGEPA